MRLFADYHPVAAQYITSQDRPFYPDYLSDAVNLYDTDIRLFESLANAAGSAEELLSKIHDESGNTRIQLLRIFRKYVSPMTSVEMLKVKAKLPEVIGAFS